MKQIPIFLEKSEFNEGRRTISTTWLVLRENGYNCDPFPSLEDVMDELEEWRKGFIDL